MKLISSTSGTGLRGIVINAFFAYLPLAQPSASFNDEVLVGAIYKATHTTSPVARLHEGDCWSSNFSAVGPAPRPKMVIVPGVNQLFRCASAKKNDFRRLKFTQSDTGRRFKSSVAALWQHFCTVRLRLAKRIPINAHIYVIMTRNVASTHFTLAGKAMPRTSLAMAAQMDMPCTVTMSLNVSSPIFMVTISPIAIWTLGPRVIAKSTVTPLALGFSVRDKGDEMGASHIDDSILG